MPEFVFMIIFYIVFFVLLFVMLTRKGRNTLVKWTYGEIVKDYGILSEERIYIGKQKVRLLECRKKDEHFFLLETEYVVLLSFQFYYTKINTETAFKLADILSEKKESQANRPSMA